MGEERSRILDLLAAGKITAEEAARLLDALESRADAAGRRGNGGKGWSVRDPEVHVRQSCERQR